MGQCSCRCPEMSYFKAGCRYSEVHPGQSHHGFDWKSQRLMTQWWLWLMKKYISKSGKLLSKLEPAHTHVNLHVIDWLATQQEDPILKTMIKWISNWKVQDLKASLGRTCKSWRGNGHPLRTEEAKTLPRSPLSLPYTDQWARRSHAVCSLQSSSGCCYEWMS